MKKLFERLIDSIKLIVEKNKKRDVFKLFENASIVDVIFIAAFVSFLFVPGARINNDAYSDFENRFLAEKPALFTSDKKLNHNFGNEFNCWFGDRFNLRDELYDFYCTVKFYLNKNYVIKDNYLIKKTNWMHYRYNGLLFKEKYIAFNVINELAEFCKKNGIKLYILVGPEKSSVYGDNLYPFFSRTITKSDNDFVYYLQKYSKAKIIYPYEQIKKASEEKFVHFKTDHHWTEYGAYLGYLALIDEIKKDFPSVIAVSLDKYNISYSKLVRAEFKREYEPGFMLLHTPYIRKFADKILDTVYEYYDYKYDDMKVDSVWDEKRHGRDFYSPNAPDLKVFQIGNSLNENLNTFLPHSFRSVKYYRLNGPIGRKRAEEYKLMKYYKDIILEYKPDIFIYCTDVIGMKQIGDFFNED